jgi:hypothetical protein
MSIDLIDTKRRSSGCIEIVCNEKREECVDQTHTTSFIFCFHMDCGSLNGIDNVDTLAVSTLNNTTRIPMTAMIGIIFFSWVVCKTTHPVNFCLSNTTSFICLMSFTNRTHTEKKQCTCFWVHSFGFAFYRTNHFLVVQK